MNLSFAPSGSAISAQLVEHRAMLLRIARRKLRNEAWAEDAVSETVLAALERPQNFEGRSSARTWLVGILEHKTVDQVRRQLREASLTDADGEQRDPEENDFTEQLQAAASGGDPADALQRRQFLTGLDAALQELPERLSRAFVMSTCLGGDTAEVCGELGVSPNHLGVMLYRARQRLREALAPHGNANAATDAARRTHRAKSSRIHHAAPAAVCAS